MYELEALIMVPMALSSYLIFASRRVWITGLLTGLVGILHMVHVGLNAGDIVQPIIGIAINISIILMFLIVGELTGNVEERANIPPLLSILSSSIIMLVIITSIELSAEAVIGLVLVINGSLIMVAERDLVKIMSLIILLSSGSQMLLAGITGGESLFSGISSMVDLIIIACLGFMTISVYKHYGTRSIEVLSELRW